MTLTRKSKTLRFPTRFSEGRPFMIGGRSFLSKLLNGEEEMEFQRIQLAAQSAPDAVTSRAELGFIADVLQFRALEGEQVTPEWLSDRLTKTQGHKMLSYLRTGEGLKPGETFDPVTFENEEGGTTFEIEDRTFKAVSMNYTEALLIQDVSAKFEAVDLAESGIGLVSEVAEIAPEGGEAAGIRRLMADTVERGLDVHNRVLLLNRALSDATAQLLNTRLVEGEPISGRWLFTTLNEKFIGHILTYLTTGEIETEEADPDAPEEGEDTPNIPLTAPAAG